MSKFELIYADPPWTYKDSMNPGKRGAVHKFNLMSLRDICALPVKEIAADNCLLAMWHVDTMPKEALAVVEAWGFKFKKMKGFSWHKLTVHGKDHFGNGHYTRCNTEDCLFAVKGRPAIVNRSVRQFIESVKGTHSQKPTEARDRLVTLLGDVPRVELFARTRSPGWSCWGDEIESDPVFPSLG